MSKRLNSDLYQKCTYHDLKFLIPKTLEFGSQEVHHETCQQNLTFNQMIQCYPNSQEGQIKMYLFYQKMAPFTKLHTHMFLILSKHPLEMSALCNTS